MSEKLTHLDDDLNPSMVGVGGKKVSRRRARAQSIVVVNEAILQQLDGGELHTKKGPVFQTAIIAGIMAAKQTGNLIPLCHPIGLDHCEVNIHINEQQEIVVDCTAEIHAKTGVEMEALTGATVAALTIYDMCKAMSHDLVIKQTQLMEKTGGKRDFFRNPKTTP